MSNIQTRPPLESLTCVNPSCDLVGQTGQNNLIIRKVCGKDQIRYLRCRTCFAGQKDNGVCASQIDEICARMVDDDGLQLVSRKQDAQRANPPTNGQKKYVQHTPAMAARLTDHVWSVAEILRTPIPRYAGWR